MIALPLFFYSPMVSGKAYRTGLKQGPNLFFGVSIGAAMDFLAYFLN